MGWGGGECMLGRGEEMEGGCVDVCVEGGGCTDVGVKGYDERISITKVYSI